MNSLQHTIRLIEEHGLVLSLVRKTGGDVDPVTGVRADQTETSYCLAGVQISDRHVIEGLFGAIGSSDKVFMIDTTIKPLLGDKIAVDGKVLAVNDVQSYNVKNVPAYHVVRLVK